MQENNQKHTLFCITFAVIRLNLNFALFCLKHDPQPFVQNQDITTSAKLPYRRMVHHQITRLQSPRFLYLLQRNLQQQSKEQNKTEVVTPC